MIKANKKDEILKLLDYQIEKFLKDSDTIDFYLIKVEGVNNNVLYTTSMNVGFLYSFLYKVPSEVQMENELNIAKLESITKLLNNEIDYTLPNSIVINLNTNSEEENTKFIKLINIDESSDKLKLLKIDLRGYREYINTVNEDENGNILNPEKVFIGVLIDGLYRIEALYNSKNIDMQLPVSLYLDLPTEHYFQIFSNINKFQEKPLYNRNLMMTSMSGLTEDLMELSRNYLLELNNSEKSILKDRVRLDGIKRHKGMSRAFIGEKVLMYNLDKYVVPTLSRYTFVSGFTLLNSYFEAWKEVYPKAWGDREHILTKSSGITILCRIFKDIYTIAMFNERTTSLNKEIFKKYILDIFNEKIIDIGGESLELNWESKSFGKYSNGKGMNNMCKVLSKIMSEYQYSLLDRNS